jgi:hypothetical protein
MNRIMTGGVVGAALLACQAGADIVQDAGIFDLAISVHQPVGQSFQAVDSHISAIAFAFSNINPSFPNDPVTMSLYAGEGYGGVLLGSVTQTLPAVLPSTSATPEFIDFDFSGLVLEAGAMYTVAVTTSNSPKIAVVYSTSNPYAGGTFFSPAYGGGVAGWDLNFRVTAEVCAADLAAPFGSLDFFDLARFLELYNSGDAAADLAAPFGVLNFFDLSGYIALYGAGCP